MADLPADLTALPIDALELKATNMVGVDALRALFNAGPAQAPARSAVAVPAAG